MESLRAAASRSARAEMDVNYFGLLRLAQEFGPAMRRARRGRPVERDGVGQHSVGVRAQRISRRTEHFLPRRRPRLSLSQCLRAEMRPGGIRVINVFPGPIDDEWNQTLPPPKLALCGARQSDGQGAQDGVEDVYPGEVAQEWLARLRENPKTLERSSQSEASSNLFRERYIRCPLAH